MLDTIPAEILAHIAYHLALPTLSPPLALLQSCKSIHEAISPASNPRLYARLFRSAFDWAAAERRVDDGELNAGQVTRELQRRITALRRVGAMIRKGDVLGVTVEELWVIYIMLTENDGKNIQHFVDPDALLPLHRFVELYQDQHLLSAAVEPGFPRETTERALIMWIAWLLSGYESARGIYPERPEQRDERLFILRPYVFAPQQYELCFAPWTVPDLPITEPQRARDERNPFIADLTPKSRRVTVEHFGRRLDISGPMLSHAAILLFFVKRPGAPQEEDGGVLLPFQALLGRAAQAAQAAGVDNAHAGNHAAVGTQGLEVDGTARSAEEDDEDDGDESFGAIRDLISTSKNHDRDFARLRACYDPFVCRGMRRAAWRGSWEGSWEGNFSFFDLEAFRDMLAGQSRALYEGSFGEQAQVWRLTETWVWRKTWGVKKRKQREREREEKLRRRKEREENGETVSDDEDMVLDKGKERARGLPLTGPATNAGFPTDLPPSTSAGLATAAAEAITLKETIKQQVDAIEGYEIVPDHELEEALSLEDGGEEAGLETILTGVGHSAWGRFVLKGKVRAWDGMASLVKEYAPDLRGKWIYRGYIVSGDIFVGRWRDTFTPEAFVGYEGTFILNRR